MKSFKVQASLLLLAMSLLLSASAHGDQFNVFANATTFWDTLTVRTDPGVSITWLGTSNLTSCGQNLDGTVGVGGQSIPNWNPVSLSTQIGGLAAFGEATTQNLSSTLDWTCLWRIDTVGVKRPDPRSTQQPRTQAPDDLIGGLPKVDRIPERSRVFGKSRSHWCLI